MIIQVEDTLCRVISATDDEHAWMAKYLSFSDSGFKKRSSSRVTLYNARHGSFPGGMLPLVQDAATRDSQRIELLDRRSCRVVPDAGADLKWLRDYQLEAVEACVRAKRGIVRAPTGCLTGDTLIPINRAGVGLPVRLDVLVSRLEGKAMRNRSRHGVDGEGRLCSWDLTIPTYAQSIDAEGYMRKNKIVRSWRNGMAEVYEVLTETGQRLRATAEHEFMSEGAFVRLADLGPGDLVTRVVWPKIDAARPKRKPLYKQVQGMLAHPHAVRIDQSSREGAIYRVPQHRLVAEARINRIPYDKFVKYIRDGNVRTFQFLGPKFHVHHKDGDSQNNHPDNLEVLCQRDHHSQHGKEDGWKHVAGRAAADRIVSVTKVGEEETYDLELTAPMNNYVANGLVVHNSGKGDMIVGLVRRLPGRWLFLVHRDNLVDQQSKRFLKIDGRPGHVLSRTTPDEWRVQPGINLMTLQSLAAGIRRDKDAVDRALSHLDGVVVDECHVAPADVYFKSINRCSAEYRIGFSGTPLDRTDNRSLMAIACLGRVIYQVKASVLIERGVLARPQIVIVKVRQTPSPEARMDGFHGLYDELIASSAERNAKIIELVQAAPKPCMVFVKQIEHGRTLRRLLEEARVQCEFVWGSTQSEARAGAIQRLERRDTDVMIASVVFQEGVDIPSLESVVIASGGKSVIAALQRIGRGMRTNNGVKGSFQVFDILDLGAPMLEKHSQRRMKTYVREGYETVIRGDDGSLVDYAPRLLTRAQKRGADLAR